MCVRIVPARAAQVNMEKIGKPEIGKIQIRMLARDDQHGRNAARRQRMRDGRQFDCFRPGADHQPYIGKSQPSP
jgi:hypothetical protein